MDLVNKTPIPAELRTGSPVGPDGRAGALLAKATFRIVERPSGAAQETHTLDLETQDPVPLHAQDKKTELGLRPRDDLVHDNEVFEVILLGKAYVPGAHRPAPATMVNLSVGSVERELLVVGDRQWTNGGSVMTEPEPFETMPLTWDRAFGGTAVVEIDEESFLEVADPRNRAGRGFDAEAAAEGLDGTFEAPSGYPRLDRQRRLPNLEDPENRIQSPDDSPDPVCWATLPMTSGLRMQQVVEDIPEDELTSQRLLQEDAILHRAHPEWVIPVPPREARVTLRNATPDGLLSFRMPALSVVFDYINGGPTATRPLPPQVLVLEPEEMRLTLTYRKPFVFPYQEGAERGIRLRTEEAWYETENPET